MFPAKAAAYSRFMADAKQAQSAVQSGDTARAPNSAILPHNASAESDVLVLTTTADDLGKTGQWTVPRRITAASTSGLIVLDFTQATCAYPEVAVELVTRAGWIELILPSGWSARIDPASTNVPHISSKAATTADAGAPSLLVTGHPNLGQIVIRQQRRRRR